jgi:hypothetical protein
MYTMHFHTADGGGGQEYTLHVQTQRLLLVLNFLYDVKS